MVTSQPWPVLQPFEDWKATFETVHLWCQMLGKVRLAFSPPVNHSWGSTLYVSTRGITTSPIPYRGGAFALELDFTDHRLIAEDTTGRRRSFGLAGHSVASFYRELISLLTELGIEATIYPWPVEIPDPITPFDEDESHASYDETAIHEFWKALVHVDRVFSAFRARYIGKSSPVHFFWGAFDLAVTRFSGRPAPRHPGGVPNCPDRVMVEAYSHELSSAGFWPGGGVGHASFYAYAYPEPDGFRDAAVDPQEARYSDDLGEYLLPYSVVQAAQNPDDVLLRFLQTTYEAAADNARWDRAQVERSPAEP